jgi:sulfite exporter TauE/SafE/copper chaperone CopZ
MATIELPVAGMTCRACELRISRALADVPGVTRATASANRGVAVVHSDGPLRRSELVLAVRGAGYEVGTADRPWLSRDRRIWRDVALAAGGVAILVVAASVTGLADLSGRATDGGTGLAVVLLLGVAAGLSTCMALVGGLVLAASAGYAAKHPDLSAAARLRPHVAFGIGRLVGFAVLGAAIGALGSAVTFNPRVVAVGMIVVSVVMGIVGLRLAAVSPRLAGAGFALPSGLATRLRLDAVGTTYHDHTTALLGAGTFFLPCGFTQAVQVLAISTGSPVRAGTIMAVFALGTAPGIFGLGGLTAVVRGASSQRFLRFAGVVVVAFALVNVNGALHVLTPAIFLPPGATATQLSANVTLDGDLQVLHTVQLAGGYEPADAVVYAGREVRWELESKAITCAATIQSDDLGIDVTLQPGDNVLSFTPTEPGVLRYSCFMGMYGGTITVIPDPAATPATTTTTTTPTATTAPTA